MISAALVLLLQVGPNPSASTPVTAVPPELYELRQRLNTRQQDAVVDLRPDRLKLCLARGDQDSTAAKTEAAEWRSNAGDDEQADALHCLGYAQARSGEWKEAASSFLAARDAVSGDDPAYRARLGTIAANAMISSGDNVAALAALDVAETDAKSASFPQLSYEIALDRARSLVALGRPEEAKAALATARELTSANARAWLLSATLARRTNDLPAAQQFIEQAVLLDPSNTQIGLEAGVIAVLSGNDDAARRSWQSVTTIAPGSDDAQTAQSYLDQLAGLNPLPDQ